MRRMSLPNLLPPGLAALSIGLAALAPARAQPAPPCPGSGAAVLERFIAADCPACWAADGSPHPAAARPAWLFDWITPVPAGDDAALAAAASPEGRARAERLQAPVPASAEQQVRRQDRLPMLKGLRLQVQSGPAWSGYFGLQLTVQGVVPPGSSGWLALVEHLPAGSEGSALPRQLMRSVVGPLSLEGAARRGGTQHLRALRWPTGAEPARLEARGWIEAADGQLLAVNEARCPARR